MLKLIDIYGEEIKLRLNNKDKVYSSAGGIFSIITVIAALVCGWVLGNDVVYRLKPRYYSEEAFLPKRPLINMDKNNFPLVLNIVDLSNRRLNMETYFKIEASYIRLERDLKGSTNFTKKIIPLVNCTQDNFPSINVTSDP